MFAIGVVETFVCDVEEMRGQVNQIAQSAGKGANLHQEK